MGNLGWGAWLGKSLLGSDSWENSPDYNRYMGLNRSFQRLCTNHKAKKAQRKAQRLARRRNR